MRGGSSDRKLAENEVNAIVLLCKESHPNIIEVLEHGQLSAAQYYVDMELCYISLEDLLKQEERDDRKEDWFLHWPIKDFNDRLFFIIALIQELANGLYFIHNHDQVHRDIKPGNGKLSRSGQN